MLNNDCKSIQVNCCGKNCINTVTIPGGPRILEGKHFCWKCTITNYIKRIGKKYV